jgi:hypothetical protein
VKELGRLESTKEDAMVEKCAMEELPRFRVLSENENEKKMEWWRRSTATMIKIAATESHLRKRRK